jgi:hypothetical protein
MRAGLSTPIVVAPLAAWRLGEDLGPKVAAGVAVIASPSFAVGGERALAYAMLMGAAAAWAVTIVTVRGHRFTSSALNLAPWQMLIASRPALARHPTTLFDFLRSMGAP